MKAKTAINTQFAAGVTNALAPVPTSSRLTRTPSSFNV
jgi:hypothetical protein